jgi:hypothetical protein
VVDDRTRGRAPRRWRWGARLRALVVAFVAVTASCSSQQPACTPGPPDPACPDLHFSGQLYDEWREHDPGQAVLQELGDASYPACNDEEVCGPDLGGFAATDVWLLRGVDPDEAVLGFRENTRTYVIFVRRGLDPAEVKGLPASP